MNDVTFTDSGPADGTSRPLLLLHGGGGPLTVAGFGALLAANGYRVITPSHPGFNGTARPDELDSIGGIALLYLGLLDELGLDDVTVVGNSMGGWIAAEMAVAGSPRLGHVVLVDAVGIEVPGHPVANFFSLTFPELAELSYFAPAKFQIDPSTMSPQQLAGMAGNRAALEVYAGHAMTDATLLGRLGGIQVPTLVIWGEADRIVDPTYGRAFADAIPGARFELLSETGHLPQLESPEKLLAVLQS
jgi:pimeloyl-ACP methyl ester carboxylesterase